MKDTSKFKVILSDIAGTTTSLDFITNGLFKYAVDNVKKFLEENWENDQVQRALKLFCDKHVAIEEAVCTFQQKTNKNDSNEGLKILQGLIYKEGYSRGRLQAHVFPDVPKKFKEWSQESQKLQLAIYSTGSTESQKLLFSNTAYGDLTECIDNYFDLTIGLKTDPQSYIKIGHSLNVKTEEILFLTDSLAEAKAAKKAGCGYYLLLRPGNQPFPTDGVKSEYIISTFDELNV